MPRKQFEPAHPKYHPATEIPEPPIDPPPPPFVDPVHTLAKAFSLGEKITGFPPMAAAFRPNGDLVIIAHDGKKYIIEKSNLP